MNRKWVRVTLSIFMDQLRYKLWLVIYVCIWLMRSVPDSETVASSSKDSRSASYENSEISLTERRSDNP
jgi:hypothetical protein